MFARAGFTEEGIEAIISTTNGFVRWHLTIGSDAMFQTVQLPASITDLDSGLANVYRNTFTLKEELHDCKGSYLIRLNHKTDIKI